jgi:hypothetical protein
MDLIAGTKLPIWLAMGILLLASCIIHADVQFSSTKPFTRCSLELPGEEYVKEMLRYQARGASVKDDGETFYFPIVFHVFEYDKEGIVVPEEAIYEQVKHANAAFSGTTPDSKIRFTVKRVNRYNDSVLASSCMRVSNRQGSYQLTLSDPSSLHIFVCDSRGEELLGVARLPCQYDQASDAIFDGAMWLNFRHMRTVRDIYEAVPPYDEGDTFIHVSFLSNE